jgi:hypothetical protein
MFLIRSTFVRTLIGLGLGSFVIGCGGPEQEALAQEQELGTLDSALCTDPGAENHTAPLGSPPGDKVSATSSAPYQNNSLCPTYFVVDATQTYGKKVHVSAEWVDSSVRDSEARCKAARLEATAYGSVLFSGWVTLNQVTVAGSWDSVFGCSFVWTPSVEVASFETARYTRIRIAAKAYINTLYGPYYLPVTGSIRIPVDVP